MRRSSNKGLVTTKASKFSSEHRRHLKTLGIKTLHLNVSHFQECSSSASTNSDEETVSLRGRPQIMQSVFLLSRPQTQKCLHTVAKNWEHNDSHARWEEERKKMGSCGQKEESEKKHRGEEEETGHSNRKLAEKVEKGNKSRVRNSERGMWGDENTCRLKS